MAGGLGLEEDGKSEKRGVAWDSCDAEELSS